MSRYQNYVFPHNQDTIQDTMARTRKANQDDSCYEGFTTTSEDAKFVREQLVKEPFRFLNEVGDMNRPARVVDKLRKAFVRLIRFNRDSMKNGIRRILNEDDIKSQIHSYFGGNGKKPGQDIRVADDDGEDSDALVSENENGGQNQHLTLYHQLLNQYSIKLANFLFILSTELTATIAYNFARISHMLHFQEESIQHQPLHLHPLHCLLLACWVLQLVVSLLRVLAVYKNRI